MADMFGFEEAVTSPDEGGGAATSLRTPMVSYEVYRREHNGEDPFKIYNDYMGQVAPEQIMASGYDKEEATQIVQALMQRIPPPPRSAKEVDEDLYERDRGPLGNAGHAVLSSFSQMGGEVAAGAQLLTGDQKGLAKSLREHVIEAKKVSPSLRKFREIKDEGNGVWDFLSNTTKASFAYPEALPDAFLGMLAGFTPIMAGSIAGGAIGGAVGTAVPVIGNVAGGIAGSAAGMAATSAVLELGSKTFSKMLEGLAKDGIDPLDETAVTQWLKDNGEKVLGPALKAALTNGALTLIAGGIAGRLSQTSNELLGTLNKVKGGELMAEKGAEQGLRRGVRNYELGSMAANAGGFTAASAGGSLAAGDEVRARDLAESALTMMLAQGRHTYKAVKEAKRLAREIEAGRKPVVEESPLRQPVVEAPKELTEAEMEQQLREEEDVGQAKKPKYAAPKDDLEKEIHSILGEEALQEYRNAPDKEVWWNEQIEKTATTITVAQDLVKEVNEARYQKAADEVKAELEARQGGERPPVAPETGAQSERPNIQSAGVPADQQRVGEVDQGKPIDRTGVSSAEEVTGQGPSGRPELSEPTGVAGADSEAVASRPVVPERDTGGTQGVGEQGAVEQPTNPASLTPTHEVANQYREVITEANLELTRAQIKGDTRAEAAAQERIAKLNREAKDWLNITSDLEAERINKALHALIKNGSIKEGEAAFYRALTEGDTAEALRQLASNKKALSLHRALATQLLKLNIVPETRFLSLKDKTHLGEYSMGLDAVILDSGYFLQRIARNGVRDLENTLLHEVMHAATFNALMRAYRARAVGPSFSTKEYLASQEYKSAVKLFETFEWLKKNHPDKFKEKTHYGATNPAELVAEVYVNPRLQEYLKGVTLPKELTGGLPKNAWQWIVDLFKNVLGLKGVENNALEAIMAHTSQVARERAELPPMSKYNRAMATDAEIHGNRLFYTDYPPANTKKTQSAKDATEELRRELGSAGMADKAEPLGTDLSKLSVERLDAMREQVAKEYTTGKITFEQYKDRADPIIKAWVTASRRENLQNNAGKLKEVAEGYKRLPEGTRVRATHGLKYKEPQLATVVGDKVMQFEDGLYVLPRVDFGDGVPRTLLPSDIKEVFGGPRKGLKPVNPGAAAPEEPKTPRTSIKGINNDTGMRESIAYLQTSGENKGKYNYYEVTREYPTGDPDTKVVGMSREEVLRKNEGRRIDMHEAEPEPQTKRSALHGWKDGKWQFGAIAMKDENGKPTGEWRVTTGEDLQNKDLPRDRVTVDSYDEVRKLFGEGGYSRTKRVEEAKELLKDLSGLPELTVPMPGKWVRYMADQEKASEHLGEISRYEVEHAAAEQGLLLPLSARVDLAKILKTVRIQKEENHLERTRLKPLEKEGRELSTKYKRSKMQIENDMINLAYIDRVNKKINSGLYDPLPEAQEVVTRQIAEAIDNLRKNAPKGSAYRTDLEAYARKWKKLSNDMYDYMIKNGLITKEKADEIRMGSDEFYVPIREDDKSTTGHRATGLGAKGTDPILRIVNDWNLQIKRNYENKVKVAAFNLGRIFNLKLPDGTKLFEFEPILKYDFDSHGELVQKVESLAMSRNSITVMIDGKPYRMKINTPEALEALEQVPREKHDEVKTAMISAGAMVNSIYGALKTAASPVFALKNPPRDVGTALGLADSRVSRRQFIKSLTNGQLWKDAFMEATQPWHGKEVNSREHEAFISRRGLHGINPLRNNPTVNINPTPMQRGNQLRRRLFGFEEGAITNFLTVCTKLGENIIRAAVFDAAVNSPRMHESVGKLSGTTGEAVRTAIEKGNRGEPTTAKEKELIDYMLSEAAAAGKKGTVNFEPKGKASGLMNAMFVFNNAVQRGADTYLDAMGLTKMRGGKNIVERFQRGNRYAQYGTLTALVMGMMNALYNYSNDEDGKYAQMSDQQKDNGFVTGNGKFAVPIPQEFGIAWTLGQVLVDMFKNTRYVNEDMRRSKAINRLLTRIAQTFWPSVPMSDPTEDRAGASAQFGVHTMLPTMIAMGGDVGFNRNPFGSPIITKMGPEDRPGKDVPLYAHNADKVSPLARQMSQKGHDVLGMNVAPEINQYMVDQWFKVQTDMMHSLPEAFQFLNGVFGEPKRDPETGNEKPNVFRRAFFPEYHPLSYKTDIQDLIDYEASKSRDTGEKHSEKLNLLKRGKERASKLARQQRYKEAEAVSVDTLKRYNALVRAAREGATQ